MPFPGCAPSSASASSTFCFRPRFVGACVEYLRQIHATVQGRSCLFKVCVHEACCMTFAVFTASVRLTSPTGAGSMSRSTTSSSPSPAIQNVGHREFNQHMHAVIDWIRCHDSSRAGQPRLVSTDCSMTSPAFDQPAQSGRAGNNGCLMRSTAIHVVAQRQHGVCSAGRLMTVSGTAHPAPWSRPVAAHPPCHHRCCPPGLRACQQRRSAAPSASQATHPALLRRCHRPAAWRHWCELRSVPLRYKPVRERTGTASQQPCSKHPDSVTSSQSNLLRELPCPALAIQPNAEVIIGAWYLAEQAGRHHRHHRCFHPPARASIASQSSDPRRRQQCSAAVRRRGTC